MCLLERDCLIDQHDRYAITNRITEAASMAKEQRLLFPVLERSLALGTDENFQELGREGHGDLSVGIR